MAGKVAIDSPIEALTAIVVARAGETPDRTWLQDVDGDEASYGDAVSRTRRWASALSTVGVKPGDRVATLVSNSVESVLIWLGISSIGAVETPVHPAFTGFMLEHAINTVGASVVVTEPARLDRVIASRHRLSTVHTVVVVGDAVPDDELVRGSDALLAAATTHAPEVQLHAWDPSAIIYTSGTSGPSKGVVTPWGVIRCTAQRTFVYDDLDETDSFYVFTPASHIGAKLLPYLAAMVGGRAIMRADFKIGAFLDDIRRFGITTTPAVGAIPVFLTQLPPQPDDRDIPLRNMVMAPLVPDLDGFRARFGVRICTAYNMTELSIPFASDGWNVENHLSVGKEVTGWPGVETRLVDEHDIEVPVGEVGELIVRTSEPWTLNSGYYGMAEATAAAWRNGWFHTGDAFRKDDEGYFYFVDRIKDCIRRRGENVSSFEVELLVREHPAVQEVAAVAVRSEEGEDEIKVWLVVEGDLDPAELIAFLTERMPRFMIPRYVETTDELPKTEGTLRVKKQLLRERGNSGQTWDRVAAGVTVPRP